MSKIPTIKDSAAPPKQIKVGIVGGAGYTGGELIRLLLNHPNAEIINILSSSNAGSPVSAIHQDLLGETELSFTGDYSFLRGDSIQVLFLCLGHGQAIQFLQEHSLNDRIKIIDLSQDFRLKNKALFQKRSFVYGLPELNRNKIAAAENIANPGCFATAIQLALLPLAQAGLLSDIYTTGITGSTGAGQSFSATSHFSWRANNIQAYKTLSHQHLLEISESLHQLQPNFPQEEEGRELSFVPWRGDFARGIFVSSTLTCQESLESVTALYKSFYEDHPFTFLSEQPIFLKQVVNTNKCLVQLEKKGNKLVVHSALDNLIKGASGQAIQNMNLLFGLDECAGLHLKSIAF